MARLTPTFDFGQNDTPTKALLELQARSLTVSRVGLDDLGDDILGIATGAASDATDALSLTSPAGLVWIDGDSNLWVQEGAGPVRLAPIGGGWESRRYWIDEGVDGKGRPGFPLISKANSAQGGEEYYFRSGATSLSDSSSIVLFEMLRITQNQSADDFYFGILQETATSGFRRWSGRGPTLFEDADAGGEAAFFWEQYQGANVVVIRSGGASPENTWGIKLRASVAFASPKIQGYALGAASGSSVVSDSFYSSRGHAIKQAFCGWHFGPQMMTTLTFGSLT